MIQTKTLRIFSRGLNLLIKPKDISIPKGIANINVKANIKHVSAKPPKRLCVTSKKVIFYYALKAEVILEYSMLYFSASSLR